MKQFSTRGRRLWRLARGIDDRRVVPDRGAKTISSETTFENDIRDFATLEKTAVAAVGEGLVAAARTAISRAAPSR